MSRPSGLKRSAAMLPCLTFRLCAHCSVSRCSQKSSESRHRRAQPPRSADGRRGGGRNGLGGLPCARPGPRSQRSEQGWIHCDPKSGLGSPRGCLEVTRSGARQRARRGARRALRPSLAHIQGATSSVVFGAFCSGVRLGRMDLASGPESLPKSYILYACRDGQVHLRHGAPRRAKGRPTKLENKQNEIQ